MIEPNALRFLAADMVEQAKSGHPGMPMGMATVVSVLFSKFLKFYAPEPLWPDRDRFVLSGGHGSALLYALMYLTGYPDVSLETLKSFRQLGSPAAGHPEYGALKGVEVSTGPLGQGLANAVGMALAERMLNARFQDLVNHRTYVIVGDGDLMEGISEEAISLAGHLRLNRLTALWDDNGITIDGETSKATSTDMRLRFEANGWNVTECDGLEENSIAKALTYAQTSDKPTLVICHTVIGYGAPTKAGTAAVHGAPLGTEELKKAKENLNWPYGMFEVPEAVLEASRQVGCQQESTYNNWKNNLNSSMLKEEFQAMLDGKLPTDFEEKLKNWTTNFIKEHPEPIATRKTSAFVLEAIVKLCPNLITGSADLSGSCYTKVKGSADIQADNFLGTYINYGIREHAMAAIMNGIAVHGGFIPLSSTFFSFVDYMKPSVRLAALMGVRVLYVLTHDSIGVGEDGPTHQPVEQLVSLRSVPNLYVFRPCDIVETAESYACALKAEHTPSALIFSRQSLPLLRTDLEENKVARGGYVLKESATRDITLIATGSEVALAVKVADLLADDGIQAAVVSMPCTELFDIQPNSYQQEVLGTAPRFALEMGSSLGWYKYVGDKGSVLGIDQFGESAPAQKLLEKFGFTPEHVVQQVKDFLHK